jgi:DNA-binding response OmpR family regulator
VTLVQTNRILLVDDDDDLRDVFQMGLESHGFEVVPASGVNQALSLIANENFDVLLSDLHMPDAGDGFTVVSAMRHAHPKAVTLVLSGYPALQEAIAAILLQADEVLVKPYGLAKIIDLIQSKLANPAPRIALVKERVAEILERGSDATIQHWLLSVEHNEELTKLTLDYQERTGHLPLLLSDLFRRLRLPVNAKVPVSGAAREHGILRRLQGYTVARVIEESRILQVSIFKILHDNLGTVSFDTVLLDVMTIADEVDSELKQAILGFMEEPAPRQAVNPTARPESFSSSVR